MDAAVEIFVDSPEWITIASSNDFLCSRSEERKNVPEVLEPSTSNNNNNKSLWAVAAIWGIRRNWNAPPVLPSSADPHHRVALIDAHQHHHSSKSPSAPSHLRLLRSSFTQLWPTQPNSLEGKIVMKLVTYFFFPPFIQHPLPSSSFPFEASTMFILWPFFIPPLLRARHQQIMMTHPTYTRTVSSKSYPTNINLSTLSFNVLIPLNLDTFKMNLSYRIKKTKEKWPMPKYKRGVGF